MPPAGGRYRRPRSAGQRSTAIGTAMTAASPVTIPSQCSDGHRGGPAERRGPGWPAAPLAEPPGQAGATCWLPPATRQLGRQPNPRGRVLGHGGSELAGRGACRRLDSRQVARPGRWAGLASRGHLREGASRGGRGRRRSHPCSTLADLCCADWLRRRVVHAGSRTSLCLPVPGRVRPAPRAARRSHPARTRRLSR